MKRHETGLATQAGTQEDDWFTLRFDSKNDGDAADAVHAAEQQA